MTAGHFEGKKHAVRQTQDGWVVSFVVHPNDMIADFATAPLGTRYMVGFAAIGDDEQPIPASSEAPRERPPIGSEQAASLGRLESIGAGVHTERSERAKAAYRDMTPAEQAVQRAGILAGDPRFQAWAYEQCRGPTNYGLESFTEEGAADFIRDRCCGGASRKLIATEPECMDKYIALETAFKIAVGEIAEPR